MGHRGRRSGRTTRVPTASELSLESSCGIASTPKASVPPGAGSESLAPDGQARSPHGSTMYSRRDIDDVPRMLKVVERCSLVVLVMPKFGITTDAQLQAARLLEPLVALA